MNELVIFHKEKETKGAVRYKEVDSAGGEMLLENAVIGTLYVRKSAIKGDIPNILRVTVVSGV